MRINNNSDYLTGYAANIRDADASQTNTSQYKTENGYLASTTGNITGVYDMNGGVWEYVAGCIANNPGLSGFTSTELTSAAISKHLDVYNRNSSSNSYNYRILGDATGEMGPFYNVNDIQVNNWYSDGADFINSSLPWFSRGGGFIYSTAAGQFYFHNHAGVANADVSFRITLTSNNN